MNGCCALTLRVGKGTAPEVGRSQSHRGRDSGLAPVVRHLWYSVDPGEAVSPNFCNDHMNGLGSRGSYVVWTPVVPSRAEMPHPEHEGTAPARPLVDSE